MFSGLSRSLCRVFSRHTVQSSLVLGEHHHAVQSPWFAPVMTIKTSAPLRMEPKKKKKVDPRRDLLVRDRLKKKLKKLEKVPPELIPLEDFIIQTKSLAETRVRAAPTLPSEESERRALLVKEWSRYKMKQYKDEMQAVEFALKAQSEALEELKLESEELYKAALKPDPHLLPFMHEGPSYTPSIPNYYAPDGKYNDITRVYTQ